MQKYAEIIPISLGMVSVFIIKGDTTILVDTGYPGSGETILRKVKKEGIHPDDIKLILITHGHSDHYGSAGALREKLKAKVLINYKDADNLRKGINGSLQATNWTGKLLCPIMNKGVGSKKIQIEPDMLMEDHFTLSPFGIDGEVILTPGHTQGSTSIVLNHGEVIVGDLLMGGMIRRQKPNYPIVAMDMKEIKRSIDKILASNPTKIYASHGGPFKIEDVRQRFK